MYSLVESYQGRSCTQAEFCREQNIQKSTLSYWVCKYNREHQNTEKAPGFLKLTPENRHASEVIVSLPNGIRVSGSGNEFISTVSEIYRQTL